MHERREAAHRVIQVRVLVFYSPVGYYVWLITKYMCFQITKKSILNILMGTGAAVGAYKSSIEMGRSLEASKQPARLGR